MRIPYAFAAASLLLFASTQPVRAAYITAQVEPFGAPYFPGLTPGHGASEYVVRIDWVNLASDLPWLGSTFSSFCIQRSQDVYFGGTYTYSIGALESAPTGNDSPAMTTDQATAIRRLWYLERATLGEDPTRNAAFQYAIWQILGYTYPIDGTNAALGLQIAKYRADSVRPIGVTEAYGGLANLIALKSDGAQDQIIEAPRPAPVPPALVLALMGVLPLIGLRRYFRSPAREKTPFLYQTAPFLRSSFCLAQLRPGRQRRRELRLDLVEGASRWPRRPGRDLVRELPNPGGVGGAATRERPAVLTQRFRG